MAPGSTPVWVWEYMSTSLLVDHWSLDDHDGFASLWVSFLLALWLRLRWSKSCFYVNPCESKHFSGFPLSPFFISRLLLTASVGFIFCVFWWLVTVMLMPYSSCPLWEEEPKACFLLALNSTLPRHSPCPNRLQYLSTESGVCNSKRSMML